MLTAKQRCPLDSFVASIYENYFGAIENDTQKIVALEKLDVLLNAAKHAANTTNSTTTATSKMKSFALNTHARESMRQLAEYICIVEEALAAIIFNIFLKVNSGHLGVAFQYVTVVLLPLNQNEAFAREVLKNLSVKLRGAVNTDFEIGNEFARLLQTWVIQ